MFLLKFKLIWLFFFDNRFALLEIKLALSMLLLNFEIVAGDKTTVSPVDVEFKLATLAVKNDVHVHFKPHKNIKTIN